MLNRFRYILLFGIMLFISLRAMSQLAMPDNVCIGSLKNYYVDANPIPGSTYVWKINGITQGSASNSIDITWNTEGTYLLEVQEFSATGCPGPVRSGEVVVSSCTKTLNLSSVLLEGLYNGSGTMRRANNDLGPVFSDPSISDQITVELHNSTYSSIAYTASNVDLSTTGTATVSVPAAYNGSYYITIRHRNHIETTTAALVSFSGNTISYAYDLPSKVYGDNLILMAGPGNHYAIYGGDVNQNGIVESLDMTPIDNLSASFGYSFNEDINCDGLIDSRDMTIVDNNNSGFVSSIHP